MSTTYAQQLPTKGQIYQREHYRIEVIAELPPKWARAHSYAVRIYCTHCASRSPVDEVTIMKMSELVRHTIWRTEGHDCRAHL